MNPVATISDTGVITRRQRRHGDITVTSHNGIQESCPVTVSVRTNAIDIGVEGGGRAVVSVGDSDLTLTATAIGPDGTADSVAQNFEWRVNNTSYATIRDNGDGTATVTGRRGRHRQGCRHRRRTVPASALRSTCASLSPVESCWMEPASASLFVGETRSLRRQRHARQRHAPRPHRLHLGIQR